ncbi:ABC-1 domain protein [Alkalihalophilus pseudofirmus OF4]|uniref:ABC-1 domain protein n=1 Tax=Alkalihalophilus pseudofirmus (strain ATCC BAA-2126 / JCM 17055 / OF4) TaxID=398511 RepID=D3FUG8_ALKPO|nr:AarF/ABC1/UbiB kinase family protein [Alkalihalophilus pseudofirmus]ADC50138.1 ABC-1 domain protein [Alkalihalophilus pseudofirmus OF4]
MKSLPIYRMFTIVFMSIKFFLQIIRFQRKHQNHWDEEKWNSLLHQQAREYKQTALKLEGLLIKLGQFLAARADLLPEVFLKELADLIDHVPPVPWTQTKKVLEKEWGTSYKNVLQSLTKEPIASASIGQVYKATLKTGETAAIKVQRPTISKLIKADLKALSIVMRLAGRFTIIGKTVDTTRLFNEIKRVITAELDFKQELKNGLIFKERYANSDHVHIPAFNNELTTAKVLVMEWIDGKSVINTEQIEVIPYLKEELAKRILTIFLDQLLQEGIFHADPHPGNILLKEDGTIVLIDFGMVAAIKKEDSKELQTLVEALVIDDYSQVVDSLERLRFLLPNADKQQIERMIRQFLDVALTANINGWDEDVMNQLLADFRLLLKDLPVQMPSEFAFLGRAVSTLTGVLYSIDPKLDLFELGKPIVLDWLERNREKDEYSSFSHWLRKYGAPILRFPSKLDALFDEPKLYRELQEKQHRENREHERLKWSRHYSFLFTLIGLIGILTALFFDHIALLIGSSIPLVIGGISFYATSKRL